MQNLILIQSLQESSLTASTELASDTTKHVTENPEEALTHSGDSSESISHVNACSCACCSNFDAAHQPRDLDPSKNPSGQADRPEKFEKVDSDSLV